MLRERFLDRRDFVSELGGFVPLGAEDSHPEGDRGRSDRKHREDRHRSGCFQGLHQPSSDSSDSSSEPSAPSTAVVASASPGAGGTGAASKATTIENLAMNL